MFQSDYFRFIKIISLRIALVVLGGFSASQQLTAQQLTGQPGCAAPQCLNPVPCANCNGVWTDDGRAVWNMDTQSNGSVTGSVTVPHPVQGCQSTVYSVSGSITKVYGGNTYRGYTSFTWTASNPMPSAQCGFYTPVSTVTHTGTIQNDGCDYGSGNYTTSSGLSGSFTMTKPISLPDLSPPEYTTGVGWGSVSPYETIHQWRQTINATGDFGGRQVKEGAASGNTDSCWFSGSAVAPYGLSGGGWHVGFFSYNLWADDYVGWTSPAVQYYRSNLRIPCGGTAPQIMYMYTNGNSGSSAQYRQTSVGVGIPNFSEVTSSRDGQTATKTWF